MFSTFFFFLHGKTTRCQNIFGTTKQIMSIVETKSCISWSLFTKEIQHAQRGQRDVSFTRDWKRSGYDIWSMIYDIWYMIYDIWYMIYDMIFPWWFTKFYQILPIFISYLSNPLLWSLGWWSQESKLHCRCHMQCSKGAPSWQERRWELWKLKSFFQHMGLSENRVYSQWNSHLIGIMISKTIGFRGTRHFQTHPYKMYESWCLIWYLM